MCNTGMGFIVLLHHSFVISKVEMAYFGEFGGAKFKVCNNIGGYPQYYYIHTFIGDIPIDVPSTKILERMCPRHPRLG